MNISMLQYLQHCLSLDITERTIIHFSPIQLNIPLDAEYPDIYSVMHGIPHYEISRIYRLKLKYILHTTRGNVLCRLCVNNTLCRLYTNALIIIEKPVIHGIFPRWQHSFQCWHELCVLQVVDTQSNNNSLTSTAKQFYNMA